MGAYGSDFASKCVELLALFDLGCGYAIAADQCGVSSDLILVSNEVLSMTQRSALSNVCCFSLRLWLW